jgi:hypothetical protein
MLQYVTNTSSSRNFPLLSVVAVLTSLALLTACVSSPVVVPTTLDLGPEINRDVSILIIPPCLKFESIQDEKPLKVSDYNGDAIENQMIAVAQQALNSKGFAAHDLKTYSLSSTPETDDRFRSISPKLSQGVVSDGDKLYMKQLASSDDRLSVLVSYIKVKVGTGAAWNPITGWIRTANSSCFLHSALIHCTTGQVLWKNQIFLRELPQIESESFSDSLELLYKTLPKRKQ